MQTVYNILIHISSFFIGISALFSSKMKLFVNGRKNVFLQLAARIAPEDKTVWFHCASLGEYEQGLPVIKAFKKEFPNHKIILTFFSPSGYEVKRNTAEADVVCYLPIDTKRNARKFVDAVHPDLALFVKYEIWPNYLLESQKQNIPIVLISGLFRKEQIYFKFWGGWMRKVLKTIRHFFVQNNESEALLQSIGIENITVSGDTRFDRVSQQLEQDNNLDFIEIFKNKKLCVVAGSTWEEDENMLVSYINNADNVKFIIAPHQIKPEKIAVLQKKLTNKAVLFSEKEGKNLSEYRVFIVDTIGLLTKIYNYADIAYVGGAMGTTGLHNILEPAVFGIPVVIGKNFNNFPEAKILKEKQGLFSVSNQEELALVFDKLINEEDIRKASGEKSRDFITENKGATSLIINHLKDTTY